MEIRTKIIVGVTLSFAAGFGVAFLILNQSLQDPTAHPVRQKTGYKFIQPLLGCAIDENTEARRYAPLQQKVDQIIHSYKSTSKIADASVYFRDLNSGLWMGVNETQKYAPASLYKVSLMMAYFKAADANPSLLNKKIYFAKSRETEIPDYPPMIPGKNYTVSELLEKLIANSDNDAKDLLHDNIDQKYVSSVFTDIGLEPPALDERGDSMSPKQYSSFFRILFNGTYLSKENSEKALALLSKATFTQGLTDGIPKDIVVAHKFGNRIFTGNEIENGITNELHDCGIIYAKDGPYFLCVMTKGWNIFNLESIISDISKTVYENRSQ